MADNKHSKVPMVPVCNSKYDSILSQLPVEILSQKNTTVKSFIMSDGEVSEVALSKDEQPKVGVFSEMQINSEETNAIEPIENSVIDGKPPDDLLEFQLIAKKRKWEEETFEINQSLCVLSAKKNEEKIKQPREDALKRQKLAPEV
jgi:hypothetical protein